jgi:hypothetical protein
MRGEGVISRGRRCVIIAALFALGGCSHGGGHVVPAAQTSAQSAAQIPALASNAPVRNIFEAARNKTLRDADLDKYIDPSVNGADRVLARKLMRIMPPNQRGDFVWFDPATGHRVSNNSALLAATAVGPRLHLPKTTPAIASSVQKRHVRDYSNPCGPDQPHEGTGPYGRMLSKCGFTGGIGFVNVECNMTFLNSGDQGNLYFELTNGPGITSEGGLQYNSDSSVQPYIAGLSQQLYGYTNKYTCGQDLGIYYGEVYGQNVVFVEIGNVPSSYDPRRFWSGAQYIALNNAAWRFEPSPTAFYNSHGADAAGVPSPCMNCAIAKVTSIAQHGDHDDGSYFGVDIVNDLDAIHWMQVGFGNWLNDGCGQPNQNCTLEYASSQSVYFGGPQEYYGNSGDPDVVDVQGPDPSGFGPWETYDGIWLPGGAFASVGRHPMGAFTSPLPPTCAPDSYGDCVAQSGGAPLHDETVACSIGNYPAQNTFQVGQQWWYIKNSHGGLQFYSYNGVDTSVPVDCGDVPYWSPAEPKTDLNDPNLP